MYQHRLTVKIHLSKFINKALNLIVSHCHTQVLTLRNPLGKGFAPLSLINTGLTSNRLQAVVQMRAKTPQANDSN